MSEQLPPAEPRPIEERPPTQPRAPRNPAFVAGVVLIALGIVFLLQRFGRFNLDNWWALFILIPAVGSFATAYNTYRHRGRLTMAARSSIFGGLLLLAIALVFLFNLDWAVFWPLFLLIPGLSAIVSGLPLGPADETSGPLAQRLYQPWQVWFGAGATLLGLGFLLRNLGVWDPAVIHERWWALPIFLPAIGGLIVTARLVGERGFDWLVGGHLLATLVIAAVGAVAFIGLDWNLILPLALIGAGLLFLLGIWGRRGA